MDMLHVFIISLVFPSAVWLVAPRALKHYGYDERKHKKMLLLACLLMFVSWYLPSPLIEGKDTSFTTHFLGGGVFCGLLGLYIQRTTVWRAPWYVELVALYALVSALGVANELFELALYKLHIMETVADTSWDLLANTLGALMAYVVYKVWPRS